MFSFSCFYLGVWSFTLLSFFLSKTSINMLWFFSLSMFSLFFYIFEDMLFLCLSWSIMGFSTCIMVGKSPTFYTWKATKSMIWLGNWSTFLCFIPFFSMNLDNDNYWNLFYNFPMNSMNNISFLLFFLGFGMKSLFFPFSFWLLCAMKGITVMSGMVHSLTVVFGGMFLMSYSWLEGWISSSHMQLTFFPFLLSSLYHLFFIIFEDNGKRILALSTAYSMNMCHMSLPLDMSFSFFYGLSHGFSKAFLFNSVYGSVNILWMFILGLLSGFPVSLTWNFKMWFLHGLNISFSFYMWCLSGYFFIYLKLLLKSPMCELNSFFVFSFGIMWSSFSIILSFLFF